VVLLELEFPHFEFATLKALEFAALETEEERESRM
jgi:hypothetical protein